MLAAWVTSVSADSTVTSYTYDANGNRSSKTEGGVTTSYAYDFDNHLVQVSTPTATVGAYGYSGDGLRVSKTTSAGANGFVYDGMKLLQEEDGTGATTVTYTSRGGRVSSKLLGIRQGSSSRVPLLDALGSVRILLDAAQNFTDGYAFDAFGNQISGGEDANPYRYVGAYGYYLDGETGLDLLTARYYDAAVGRFLTRDPIGFKGGDWSLNGYVRNHPTLKLDASGKQECDCYAILVQCTKDVALEYLQCAAEAAPGIFTRDTVGCVLGCIVTAGGGPEAYAACVAVCDAGLSFLLVKLIEYECGDMKDIEAESCQNAYKGCVRRQK